NQQDGTRNRTLFSLLNATCTPMGRRMLERNLLQPLTVKEKIVERLDAVEFFYIRPEFTVSIKGHLKDILDIERLISRFMMGRMLTRNFIAMKQSLKAAMKIKNLLREEGSGHASIAEIKDGITDLDQLVQRINDTIEDEPALTPEHGRVIRNGFLPELDRLHELKQDAKKWVLQYQEDEKARLGINTLRVKYNKILGYYIEISKGQASSAPPDYHRKQTLVGAERFTTDQLIKFETDILGSADKITQIEDAEIEKLRIEILQYSREIQETATAIGYLDFICSLAVAASDNRYIRPAINDSNYINIKSGRHPVVEKYYTREVFIPNDILLDDQSNVINIITGPNMAGKSTYIRMCAILQLMMQTGSFVPAESADLPVTDRIFTRIGASDNISRGESTFLVEMNETAGILNNATNRSLIIMDEVGRGTSTYDGLSIAWGVVEYILRFIRAKTLFATHYHELTSLGGKDGIVNYNVLVKETLSSVEFLHKVVPGSADKSYGIHVAKLAGLPKTVVSRAAKILEKLEKTGSGKKREIGDTADPGQLEIFNASNHIIVQTLEKIDIDNLTPVEALNELSRLKKLV
ncbi:MAG TPA: DNA mismatch repair protein MutS, partial [Spirochaetota bacterium]|nr:DNA mismatch repair protein MutS [Spirochaetota bacterium]